jgi:hypothetical protein
MTESSRETFAFTANSSRRGEAGFTAGPVCSDGGSPFLVKHQLWEILAQCIYGLVLVYEDLNDRKELRCDPLLAVLAGKRNLDETPAGKSMPMRSQGIW